MTLLPLLNHHQWQALALAKLTLCFKIFFINKLKCQFNPPNRLTLDQKLHQVANFKATLNLNNFGKKGWNWKLFLAIQPDRHQDLERVQKAAVKVILGENYENYEQALSILKVDSLNDRREKMAPRFAKTSLQNLNFSKLFSLRKVDHQMKVRNSEKYVVNKYKMLSGVCTALSPGAAKQKWFRREAKF